MKVPAPSIVRRAQRSPLRANQLSKDAGWSQYAIDTTFA
jgi:hypothetical protein